MLRNTIFNKYVERKVTWVCPSTILFDISNIIFEPYVAQVSKYPLNISKYISYRFCLICPVQNGHVPLIQLLVPTDSAFAQLFFVERTCCLDVVNFKVAKQMKTRKIVVHKYMLNNSWR